MTDSNAQGFAMQGDFKNGLPFGCFPNHVGELLIAKQ